MLEVDLRFPEELHDKFEEFPPALETLTPDIDWLTPYQQETGANAGIVHNGVFHGTNRVVSHLYYHKKLCHPVQEPKLLSRARGSGKAEAQGYIV